MNKRYPISRPRYFPWLAVLSVATLSGSGCAPCGMGPLASLLGGVGGCSVCVDETPPDMAYPDACCHGYHETTWMPMASGCYHGLPGPAHVGEPLPAGDDHFWNPPQIREDIPPPPPQQILGVELSPPPRSADDPPLDRPEEVAPQPLPTDGSLKPRRLDGAAQASLVQFRFVE